MQSESRLMKNSYDQFNKTYLNLGQLKKCNLESTSSFLKKQMTQIIKRQLKQFKMREHLATELTEFNKTIQSRNLMMRTSDGKMRNFKEKQKIQMKKKFDLYMKKQAFKNNKLQQMVVCKQNLLKDKSQRKETQLKTVKQRYTNLLNQDNQMRLSRLVMTSTSTRKESIFSQKRSISGYSSHSNSRDNRQFMKKQENQKELQLVTIYFDKLNTSEQKVLFRDMQNQSRREKSLKTKIKCLIPQRAKQQEDERKMIENQYESKMEQFQEHYCQMKETNQSFWLKRSQLGEKFRKNVQSRKELMQKIEMNKVINSYQSKITDKENFNLAFKTNMNLKNSQSSAIHNLLKMKNQHQNAQLENTMKILSEKVQKLKNMSGSQKLPEGEVKFILNLLDSSDPEYQKLSQFLKLQRKVFVENCIKKDEQRVKSQKLKLAKSQVKGLLN